MFYKKKKKNIEDAIFCAGHLLLGTENGTIELMDKKIIEA